MNKVITLIVFFSMLLISESFGQSATIRGKINDSQTREPMISANVVIKNTTTGTVTDLNGVFELEVPQNQMPVTLVISYLGYENKEITVSDPTRAVNVNLEMAAISGQEVVVSASRVSESIVEAPVSIERMGVREIEQAASGDFYQSLGNFKGVDVITSSIGFKAINMRGFNTTSPVRAVQFIDGMDNQAPGLNFPVGNLVGATELDLQSVEIISGAASALYGANAFQGVISMNTKSPYFHQGLSAQVKGGNRSYFDGQIRYAKAFGNENKWAFKVTGGYMTVDDWEADDPEANLYGDVEADVNMSNIIRQLQYDETLEDTTRENYFKLNQWLDFNQNAFPGIKTIKAPGYMERHLADYNSKSLKLGGSLHYKLTENLEASYGYKYGQGTAIYQGTNRYSINDIVFQQHKLELGGKNFFIRGYTTQEDAGNSYDIVFTGIGLSRHGITNYVSEYLSAYFDHLRLRTEDFSKDGRKEWVDEAHLLADSAARNAFYQPGTAEFDSLFNLITTNPDLQVGSKFVDKSSLKHLEGQYTFDLDFLDVIAGASFRRYSPNSFGTIFSDTLVNPGDTLEDGRADIEAEFTKIRLNEVGGYVQISKDFFGEALKLSASGRVDKNDNFPVQFSPRVSAVYTVYDNTFRVSAQSAFRIPTLQNQYINLDLGPIKLLGNLHGYDNFYTLESVQDFNALRDSVLIDAEGVEQFVGVIDPSILVPIKLDPIRPEQVKSIEAGYRRIFSNRLYIDLNAYYSVYSDFIGDIRVVEPHVGQAGEESGENQIIAGDDFYNVYQIPTNAKESVSTYGATAGFSFYFGKGLNTNINYTFNDINIEKVTDPIIPGFNTAKHRVNVGLAGRNVWKNLGFSTNLRWSGDYMWESSFGDGHVPSYYTLDAQLSYEIEKLYSTVRVGASNITDNRYRTAYGSPLLGRLIYASLTLNFTDL